MMLLVWWLVAMDAGCCRGGPDVNTVPVKMRLGPERAFASFNVGTINIDGGMR